MPRLQAPKGTRDFYPDDLLRRRYLERLWRDTSIRHGFEEIDGPVFEHADLYKIKSGEGILSEMFGVFSGKSPEDLEQVRRTGEAPLALRPEFTPTLARMFAARAGTLPRPTRWFWMQNCFRAERPQRGRLREFGQWNCDILGGTPDTADLEILATLCNLLHQAGLTPHDAEIRINSRQLTEALMERAGLPPESRPRFLQFLDGASKRSDQENTRLLAEIGVSPDLAQRYRRIVDELRSLTTRADVSHEHLDRHGLQALQRLREGLGHDQGAWISLDFDIARGLAYYTALVFEVTATGERAIAGGGRYDGLIELFGGPPTPAVGFGMGDVVLSLILADRGLIPDVDTIMDWLSRPPASYRPEAFVLTPDPALDERVRQLVAELRRGRPSPGWSSRTERRPWDADRYDPAAGGVRPLHARCSSKSTHNVAKLLQDAAAQRARYAVIIENERHATLKDLDSGAQDDSPTPLDAVGTELVRRLGP